MRLTQQAAWNFIGNLVYLIAIWILTVITTHFLGYEAVGELTLAMAVGNVFYIIQTYGLRPYQSSDVGYDYLPNDYFRIRLLTTVSGFFLCLILCPVIGLTKHQTTIVLLYGFLKASESVSDIIFGENQRHGHLEYAGYSLCIRGVIVVLGFFTGAHFFRSLTISLLLAGICGLCITFFIDFTLYRKTVSDWKNRPKKSIKSILSVGFPLFISTVLPMVITAVPRVLLERFQGTELLGYYGNVSTPAVLLTATVPTMLTVFYPIYGNAFTEGDNRRIRSVWMKTIVVSVALCGLCLTGVLLFGRPIMAFVYTDSILPYVRFLYSIMGAMLLYSLTACNNTVLISMRKNRALIYGIVIALIVCIACSVPLIRQYAITGAITVLALSYGVQVVYQVIYIVQISKREGE